MQGQYAVNISLLAYLDLMSIGDPKTEYTIKKRDKTEFAYHVLIFFFYTAIKTINKNLK